ASMLREAENYEQPRTVKRRQANQHQRQEAVNRHRPPDDGGVNQSPDARSPKYLGVFHFGNVSLLLRRQFAGAVQENFFVFFRPAFQTEEGKNDSQNI